MKTYDGSSQIDMYDFEATKENYEKLLETKKKTYFSKNKVAKCIIGDEFHRTKSLTISPDRLEELAEITVQLFTLHLKESYYVRSGNGKSASGAFQIVYAKEREKAFAIGKLELQPNRKRKRSSEDNLESSELQELLKKVEIIDNDFRQKWCHTALTERVEFYKTSDLKTILNKFQNYCNPSGYLLIKADFCTYFKKSSEEFTQKWPDLAKKIIKIAQTKKKDIEINNILTSNLPTKGEEHTQTVALILLPHLFKRITKLTTRSKSKTAWIPSVLEVKKSFIYYIKDIDDFNRTLQDANQDVLNLYAEHKLPIAPYVVVIGSSLADIKSAYVVLNEFTYQVATAALAVDLYIQSMKIFHQPFPLASNHVWQFLETTIYDFKVKPYSGVTSLIERIQKL
ncbi:uncharacterized protein LOC112454637 [Temnothorax curvispinosus]|uniref:Uncharacterized protein LOC112454637 n=1 Tax=Temnothorax curvispinosus TaxID=300111 RepID=A0A6J1PRG2_9HYME|nr:uncharacterized protein LOC112454637 [Temnothorax curvispinosus]